MVSVSTALLFVGNPTLAVEHFCDTLTNRLSGQSVDINEIEPVDGALISFHSADVIVSIRACSTPMPADKFKGSMASPLSNSANGVLGETLARHTRHLTMELSENPDAETGPTSLLTRLKLAHATTCLLAEWHIPAAVLWQHSNQLLTGSQYLQLVPDPTPWALFARATITAGGLPNQIDRTHGILIEHATDFIDRPITVLNSTLPLDQAHAAALAFLRHTVGTGEPIPHGHTFGPENGPVFRVTYVDAYDELPNGMYEISVVLNDADLAPDDAARSSGATQTSPEGYPYAGGSGLPLKTRTRSMAISYLMLVIMPPVGAILLMSNAIFGSNVWRTASVAMASIALAVAVGTYTFVSNSQETALLFGSDTIQSTSLLD